MTSCAPTPVIMSKMPMPSRTSLPSMRRTGKRLGSTRTCQPGVLRGVPGARIAKISVGSRASWPPQKTQGSGCRAAVMTGAWSGRRPRSGAMMTQRPITGSRRNSDTLASLGPGRLLLRSPLPERRNEHPWAETIPPLTTNTTSTIQDLLQLYPIAPPRTASSTTAAASSYCGRCSARPRRPGESPARPGWPIPRTRKAAAFGQRAS